MPWPTRSWFLLNPETFQTIKGQFEPQALTKEVGTNWAEHTALNRINSIAQFLNRRTTTYSFQARLYDESVFSTGDSQTILTLLESWTIPDPKTGRPPILTFWVGSDNQTNDVYIESLSGITFGRPTLLGEIRDIALTINLRVYTTFKLTDKGTFETRYHRAKVRDYYELLCWDEYGNALLGDIIRKRHPTKPNIQIADVIKLPSIEAIRTETVTQTSIALKTAYGKRDTPQKRLRLAMLDARDTPYVSHVIV